jgi:hypothetical protein
MDWSLPHAWPLAAASNFRAPAQQSAVAFEVVIVCFWPRLLLPTAGGLC